MLKKLFLLVIIIAIIGVAGGYFARNYIVKKAVEEGGTYAFKVETNLGSASLGLTAGSLGLENYKISNPKGYEADNFFEIKSGMLDISEGSVFDDELIIDSLILEGIVLNFEQIEGKGNYAELLNNIKQLNIESSSDSETKLSIKKVAIRDILVNGSLTLLGKKQYEKSFAVDNISMSNIGGDGESIAEVTATIFKELISKASVKAGGELPDFGARLDQIKDETKDKIESEVKDKLNDLGGSLLGE